MEETFEVFTEGDDKGEALYTINNTDFEFEVLYRASDTDRLLLSYNDSFYTLNNPAGTVLPLDWVQSQPAPFILTSSDTDLLTATIVGSNPPEDWMHATYDRISCLSLRELAFPGTHDAGMSEMNGGSGGIAQDTQTQTLNVGDQLKYGSRWFDIRPVIAGGHWYTGHYTWVEIAWGGSNGQSLSDIISEINSFTSSNDELIFIWLSHGLDTDKFAGDPENHLTQANWDELLSVLLEINHRVISLSSGVDLSQKLVSDFIKNGAAVLLIIDDEIKGGGNVVIDSWVSSGFFARDQLPYTGTYTNTDDLDTMTNDQLKKLNSNRPSPRSELFLLSWTLTQNVADVVNFVFASILDLAAKANPVLYEDLWINLNSESYPNVLVVDGYPSYGDLAALAMAINYYFAPSCVNTTAGEESTWDSRFAKAILSVGGYS